MPLHVPTQIVKARSPRARNAGGPAGGHSVVWIVVAHAEVGPVEEQGRDDGGDEGASEEEGADDSHPPGEAGLVSAEDAEAGELGDVGEPRDLDDQHEVVGRDVVGEPEEAAEEEDEADEGLDVAEEEDGLERMGVSAMSKPLDVSADW